MPGPDLIAREIHADEGQVDSLACRRSRAGRAILGSMASMGVERFKHPGCRGRARGRAEYPILSVPGTRRVCQSADYFLRSALA